MNHKETMSESLLNMYKNHPLQVSRTRDVFKHAPWVVRLLDNNELPSWEEVRDTIGDPWIFHREEYIKGNYDALHISCAMRDIYTAHYGFPCFSKEVIQEMIHFIDHRKVLEVCAGKGWLSKLLKDAGVDLISTDNYSWDERSRFTPWKDKFTDVIQLDALEAMDQYPDSDVIILSWPEYLSPLAAFVLNRCIERNIPLIYIGEWQGGCTANDEFFDIIDEECDCIVLSNHYIPFDGIHDNIYIVSKKK